jgi:hypothetical protein
MEITPMKTMELFFNDLTAEAQKKYLKVQGVSDASELNWEVSPIAIIEVKEEPEVGDGPEGQIANNTEN